MKILTLNNINHFYQDGSNKRYVLENVSETFETGKMYAVIGQSGSGKTTLLSLMSGLDEVQSGEIRMDNKRIDQIGYEKYRSENIGIVFQAYHLIKYMTAIENVLVAMGIQKGGKSKENERAIATNILDYLGITKSKSKRRVSGLSGGEQQRVAIGRALATNADFIFADEPTGNLDEKTQTEIIAILKSLAHEHNKCVVVVTHATEVAENADVVLKLQKGKLMRE
ncbi:MAG: ABC transporter ATP-binding protein [Culicoidibacterales bacterium]